MLLRAFRPRLRDAHRAADWINHLITITRRGDAGHVEPEVCGRIGAYAARNNSRNVRNCPEKSEAVKSQTRRRRLDAASERPHDRWPQTPAPSVTIVEMLRHVFVRVHGLDIVERVCAPVRDRPSVRHVIVPTVVRLGPRPPVGSFPLPPQARVMGVAVHRLGTAPDGRPDSVAASEGLEPPTLALGKPCSIRLSYEATRGDGCHGRGRAPSLGRR